MKKLIAILSIVLLGFAASSCYDDSAIWESMDELNEKFKTLEEACNEMNQNLESLNTLVQAMTQGDYIVEVTPLVKQGVEIGYQIVFKEHGTITIYHGEDGLDSGTVPEFGVKKDTDGVYYWTINGKWLLDDEGNKLPVSSPEGVPGVTPELKVENGKWYVSYDAGKTWTYMGDAASSDSGSCLFKDVKLTDGNLVLTMSDGTVLEFPIGERFSIVFGDFDAESIQYGKDAVVPYTIVGAQGKPSLFATSNGGIYEVEILEETEFSGKLIIKQRGTYWEEHNGLVTFFAVAEDGTTTSKMIRITTGVLYPVSGNSGDSYTVGPEGGQITFAIATNRSCEVSIDADWVSCVSTKTVEEKTLLFDVQPNDGLRRETAVAVKSGDIVLDFLIIQKPALCEFNVNFTVDPVKGGSLEVAIDTLLNKSGHTIYEYLGYSSWDEMAQEFGDYDHVCNRTGDALFLPYDRDTGEVLPYSDDSRCDAGFYHDQNGNLASSQDWYTAWMLFFRDNGQPRHLFILVNSLQFIPGEIYPLGILISTPRGDVCIAVDVYTVEYVDPEKGLYDTPASPGRYEFTIEDTIDLRTASVWDSHRNNTIEEIIKSTLGLTSYEFYNMLSSGDAICSRMSVNGETYSGYLDKYSNPSDRQQGVVSPQFNYAPTPGNIYISFDLTMIWDSNWNRYFSDAVYDAIGSTIKYYYIITYKGYELVFTHEITISGDAPEKDVIELSTIVGSFYQEDYYQQAIIQFATEGVSVSYDAAAFQTTYTGTGKILNLAIYAEKTATGRPCIPVGTYYVSSSTNEPFTWQETGVLDWGVYIYLGTYLIDVVDGIPTERELHVGTVTVTADGDIYTIVYENALIRCTYTGPIPEFQ